jgi:hypothetical protein
MARTHIPGGEKASWLFAEPAHVNGGWIRARLANLCPDFLPVTVKKELRNGRKCRNLPAVFHHRWRRAAA